MALTQMEPGLRRILAPNPSPMTEQGTNTYLLGQTDLAVIDPGPAIDAHLDAILAAVGPSQRITAILVTHSHLDHSPLARPLALATGAPVLAAGPSDWGRSATMQTLARTGLIGGGEGVDDSFAPDRRLTDGEVVTGAGWQIETLTTPGHMANHLSFVWKGALFSGDLVMGWSSSLISPPDGDMTAFYASLNGLLARHDRIYYPGHGAPVHDPQTRCAELVAHRRTRETAILDALKTAPADTAGLAERIYTDTPPALLPMAERNILAHLIDLEERNLITTDGDLSASARFRSV
ncbi:MBL fold metallo-hydrolase [Rhodophyticola sp. CCM32]|uniref:MBL fold metallo-hydrolase n=1 Tax=Rhodophyticola sp. CCM32 TaxID=2916397 RepID=UPI00107F167A|nr:MBL fold metallo-hydrolase [Rhodophyticola sp. CCM32]QBX99538.1 MBL fold metallo-hydrolase [Rhodophyticola sp. CCM32]